MTCISEIPYEILLKDATPVQCEAYIRKHCDEVFHVPGGYRLRGVFLRGGKSIPIGSSGSDILFQFVKPCTGLFVLKLSDAHDEIEKLRSSELKN
ncbi:MAG: DUF1894 domain-containing protein [Methanosarcinaceae archaeon]|nr:DUF1894 domain-containing protein [Methanosarcinaceae archaeon]